MIYSANKPNQPPLPLRPLRLWRLRTAAVIGAAIGLGVLAANKLPSGQGIAGGDLAGLIVWAAIGAIYASARNALVRRALRSGKPQQ